MALTLYCSNNEVRAALGVSDVELPDAVLDLPVYEIGLVRELNKLSTSLPAAFSTVSSVSQESRSAIQRELYDAVRLFSVYAAAKQAGVSLGVLVPKDIGDGKATLARFSDSPYKDALMRVEQMYGATRTSLASTLATYLGGATASSPTTPATVFRASSRLVDPVTGE